MFSELIPEHPIERDVLLTGVCQDSRAVSQGDLFCAMAGRDHDGKTYIADAIKKGAVAVLTDAAVDQALYEVPVVAITDLKARIGAIASRFYDMPTKYMDVIAVTGTNGKTSFTHLLADALGAGGIKCGLIGTMGYGLPGDLKSPGLTTPPAIELQQRLFELKSSGCSAVVLEASSHGLDQCRVDGCEIDTAVFTNVTHDHLDYHESFENYRQAKRQLFEFTSVRQAVLNLDDDFGRMLFEDLKDRIRCISYSRSNVAATVHCLSERYLPDGIHLSISIGQGQTDVRLSLLGQFNTLNVLAVAATLHAMGTDADEIGRRLGSLSPVPGRMDVIKRPGCPTVIVDYAHTPDALEKCLTAVRTHFGDRLVWCVFGCGGDRDKTKRPLMGEIAARLAGKIVVTDDNPRGEDSMAIVTDILEGIGHDDVMVITDRQKAIETALSEAAADDVVLVAGKGHEEYQEVSGVRHPFSDYEVIGALLGQDLDSGVSPNGKET